VLRACPKIYKSPTKANPKMSAGITKKIFFLTIPAIKKVMANIKMTRSRILIKKLISEMGGYYLKLPKV
jgi:hypothetical protein